MSKTHVYERFDVAHSSGFDDLDVTPASDGRYVLAEDAINREAVLQAQIRTLEVQLKDVRTRVVVFPKREVTFTFTHDTLGDGRVGNLFEDAFEQYHEALRADDVMQHSRNRNERPPFDWQDFTAPNGVRITARAAAVVLGEAAAM